MTALGQPVLDRPSRFHRVSLSRMLLFVCFALASVASVAADPTKGGALYATHCALCHGPRGDPIWPGAPDFRRPGALLKTDAQLVALLRQGRGAMPAYLGVLRDRELYDLLAHLRTLN